MSDNKTKPTNVSVDEFLATVSQERADEARKIIVIMARITGEPAVMWGPSIIGFGSVHYKYDSGREGDMPLLGFSPRKASLTIYFMEGFDQYEGELAQLGKVKTSKGCLYVTKLTNIDLGVLTNMIESSYKLYAKT
ncbi:MAG TPA: DUF1801 domain-containing protein [Candidatus Saccharibacteria bacterium]|nr:DUF1801 domain-containing protein [Candidatus Saccharibacteria bacterium]